MDGFYAGFLGAFIEELPTQFKANLWTKNGWVLLGILVAFIEELPTQFKVNFVNQVGRIAV
jgi:hypothetical protein